MPPYGAAARERYRDKFIAGLQTGWNFNSSQARAAAQMVFDDYGYQLDYQYIAEQLDARDRRRLELLARAAQAIQALQELGVEPEPSEDIPTDEIDSQ